MDLTKRQNVLLDRLRILIDRVAMWPLPLVITEVWGFGSFFRKKENPRDLDLQLRFTNRTPEYEAFAEVMERLLHRDTVADTPVETLADIRSEIPPRLLGLMTKWVSLFSWNMLSVPIPCVFVYSPEPLTCRLLREGLPKLSLHLENVDRGSWREKDHPVFFLWSREKPNLASNLEALNASENLRSALLQELTNFESQLAHHRKMLQGCEAVFRSAFRERRRDFEPHDWFAERMKKHGLLYHGWELDPSAEDCLGHNAAWDTLSDGELREMAEQMRAELKETQERVLVARSAAWAACRFASERPPFKKKDWIALCAYWNVPRTALSRTKVRTGLAALGLPAGRIDEECRFRKAQCFMRGSTGQLEIQEGDLTRTFEKR